jgi:hypothetical protein
MLLIYMQPAGATGTPANSLAQTADHGSRFDELAAQTVKT